MPISKEDALKSFQDFGEHEKLVRALHVHNISSSCLLKESVKRLGIHVIATFGWPLERFDLPENQYLRHTDRIGRHGPLDDISFVHSIKTFLMEGLYAEALCLLQGEIYHSNIPSFVEEWALLSFKTIALTRRYELLDGLFPRFCSVREQSGRLNNFCFAIEGFYHMRNQQWQEAVDNFRQYSIFPEDREFSEILSNAAIFLYSSLCAMMSMSPLQLKELRNSFPFGNELVLFPMADEFLHSFICYENGRCYQSLKLIEEYLQMDVHLHDMIEKIVPVIEKRLLTCFLSVFSSVSFATLSMEFAIPLDGILLDEINLTFSHN
ncbi:hypothetical protein IE077_002577 [Cardiosporidium cionae]|uniref:Uncharacterized protein n=1 Tax=Cardiosporidium cionae TaxID=476202 RepID=A0ABQ7JAM6_9APIC|nr:hypothetical protein IE077_002577 [Cardiosporidium cionae]|eukprot:KAF8820998.1 hypothetical protein IE077_002577 [Cardiosporidium cionae]